MSVSNLTKQLEDKKKELKLIESGCGNCRNNCMVKITELCKNCKKDYKNCKEIIAILEQAISEIKSKDEEIAQLKIAYNNRNDDAKDYSRVIIELQESHLIEKNLLLQKQRQEKNKLKLNKCGCGEWLFKGFYCGMKRPLGGIWLCPKCEAKQC